MTFFWRRTADDGSILVGAKRTSAFEHDINTQGFPRALGRISFLQRGMASSPIRSHRFACRFTECRRPHEWCRTAAGAPGFRRTDVVDGRDL